LNVGRRVANGTRRILRSLLSSAAADARCPRASFPLSNSVRASEDDAATKINAHASNASRHPDSVSTISALSARSFARRIELPALLIVFPPPASFVDCRPPAFARCRGVVERRRMESKGVDGGD
jgi:hypothetical protein